jgi:hypothetical protein
MYFDTVAWETVELQVLGIVLDNEDQLIRHGAPAP